MSGAQRTPLIARAIQMDMKNIDVIKAYKALLKMHQAGPFEDPAGNVQWVKEYKTYGYILVEAVSFSAGQTVEHAWCDWVLAQVAGKLGDIPNDGTAKEVRFSSRTVTWVRFQVSGGLGPNVGLQEIKVYLATDEGTQPVEE